MNAKVYNTCAKITMVAAVVLFVLYAAAFLPTKYQRQGFGKTDVTVFYVVGGAVINRVSIEPNQLYQKNKIKTAIRSISKYDGGTQFLYPPAAALFFVPFAITSFNASASLWLWLSAGLFVLAYYLSVAFLIPDKCIYKFRYSILLVALAFSAPVFTLFKSGQINGVMWVLFILGFILLGQHKRVFSGISFAIPIILKLFSVFFLLPVLFRKQWVVLGVSVTTMVAVFILSLAFFDFSSYQNYWDHILPGLARGDVGDIYSSPSLFAVYRYDVREGWFDFFYLPRKALAELGRQVHSVLTVVTLGGLSLGWFLNSRRERKETDDLFEYSQVILFVLLFSISVHGQWLIWSLPLSLFLVSFNWSKRAMPFLALGYISLFLTHFYNTIPWLEQLGWTLLKPSTAGLLLLFIFSIFGARKWFGRYLPGEIKVKST